MKVLRGELRKDKLLSIPEIEYTFFLALGHVSNEINATKKMLYWAANTPIHNEGDDHGRFTLMLFLTRLLAGQLNEAWEFLQKSYLKTTLGRDYADQLDAESTDDLKSIRRYFSSRNNCNQIRNHFAFHYSAAEISGILPSVNDKLLIYLERESVPNNLFFCSEVLIAHALLDLLGRDAGPLTMEDIVGELFDVALWFAHVSDGLMDAIIKKNGKEPRAGPSEEMHFAELEPFQSIRIPWFTDTTEVVNKQQPSV